MRADIDGAERVLELLRKWGWEVGVQRIQASLAGLASPEEQRVARQFIGWMAAERGDYARAEEELMPLVEIREVAGWALLGLAFVAMRARNTDLALQRLQHAEEFAVADPALLAGVRLLQGTTRFHRGETDGVLEQFEEAAALAGAERFSYGRIMDALGMWYAGRDNVQAAIEFFTRALEHKQRFQDDAGLAVTHGQLGRLHLDWGQLDLAEHHFCEDLEICRRVDDRRGECQMYNLLGQVALARGDLAGASEYLHYSVEGAKAGGWTVLEGYARKDLALCHLREHDTVAANEQLDLARQFFEQAAFEEGLAHVQRVRGILFRNEDQWIESDQCLRRALIFFEQANEQAEAARTRLESALTLKARGAPTPLVRDEFIRAVESAEKSRRPQLVQSADRELAAVDPAAGARHVYRRIRGTRIDEDSTSLTSAERDTVTIFFFDLQGFTAWSRETDPSVVMLSLNQMMAAFREATVRHEVQVIEYMGDGFLALSRGPNHAHRGVQAALDLYVALDEFNRPRRTLSLPAFACRIGISTGEVVLGNVGTYDKIDYRAVGTTVNLAARIQNEARPDCPCVSDATWQAVQNDFSVAGDSPRRLVLKGLGEVTVWDVTGLAGGAK